MENSTQPRGEATTELGRLRAAEQAMRERVSQVDAEARRATAELAEAREALVQLERSAAGGPTQQQR